MSADMADYLEHLGAGEIRTWEHAVLELRSILGQKTAGVLSRAFGVTRRTGERWVARAEGSASQSSDPTKRNPQRGAELMKVARDIRGAAKLRAARKIKAGKVRVISKSPKKGGLDPRPRKIGDRDVTGELATAVQAAADLLQDGEYGRAAYVLEEGLLEAYGVPEGTLEIDSYEQGPEIE